MDDRVNSPIARTTKDEAKRAQLRGRWRRICLKELKETLRDRRTIVTLVLMPLLVYPLLGVVFKRFIVTAHGSFQETKISIGVDSDHTAVLMNQLLKGDALLETAPGSTDRIAAEENLRSIKPKFPPSFESITFFSGEDLEAEVENGGLSLAAVLQTGAESGNISRPLHWELVTRENSANGGIAVRFVRDRLQAVNDDYLQTKLAQAGLQVNLPVVTTRRTIPGEVESFSMTTLIPLILILMTITGAVYPAIDLTAGERERGTLEPLMAAPIPRIRLLLAKYFAVVAVALLTAIANLVAMTVTSASFGLGQLLFGEAGITLGLVLSVFALLVLFATFFSAIVLALSSCARSFKEAQAYLIPLMLLCLAPGVMSLLPELEFTRILAITPLVNIVLLARDLFDSRVDPVLACMAVGSTALYTFAAICLAARIFGTDAILYGSQATWSDFLRRPKEPRETATISGAAWCLALTFPIYVILVSCLGRVPGSMTVRFVLAGCATAIVFGGVPLACALVQRVRIGSGFGLRGATPLAFLAVLLLGASLWPFARELFLLNKAIGLDPLGQGHEKQVTALLAELRAVNPAVILISFAIFPAVFEEFLFRGFLFNAVRRRMPAAATIVVTAVVFGGFHVVAANALSPEKLLPSTFLGLILGWVCYRAGSVIPGMVLHACHNGLMLMIVHKVARGSSLPAFLQADETGHLLPATYAAAAIGVLVGGATLCFSRGKTRADQASEIGRASRME